MRRSGYAPSKTRATAPSAALGMTEFDLHKAVAEYLDLTVRPPWFWTTFPAGGGGKVRGAKLKAMGLKAGMPDILVFAPGRTFGIELKLPRNYLDPVQREVHAALKGAGVRCYTAKDVGQVALILRVEAKTYRSVDEPADRDHIAGTQS